MSHLREGVGKLKDGGKENSDTVTERWEGDQTRRPRGRAQLEDNEGRTSILINNYNQAISRDET